LYVSLSLLYFPIFLLLVVGFKEFWDNPVSSSPSASSDVSSYVPDSWVSGISLGSRGGGGSLLACLSASGLFFFSVVFYVIGNSSS
jgi:hypothetical protein